MAEGRLPRFFPSPTRQPVPHVVVEEVVFKPYAKQLCSAAFGCNRVVPVLDQLNGATQFGLGVRAPNRYDQIFFDSVRQKHPHAVLQVDHFFEGEFAIVVNELQGVLATKPQSRFGEVRWIVTGIELLIEVGVMEGIVFVVQIAALGIEKLWQFVELHQLCPHLSGPRSCNRHFVLSRGVRQIGNRCVPEIEYVPLPVCIGEVGARLRPDTHGGLPFLEVSRPHHL